MILKIPKHLDVLHDEISKKIEVTYLNDYDYYSPDDRELLYRRLNDISDGDTVSLFPECLCKNIQREYDRGSICPKCNTEVKDRLKDFYPDLWVEIPEEYEYWVNPTFINRFEESLPVVARGLFRWLGDREYNPKIKKLGIQIAEVEIFRAIQDMPNFERSYKFFINNIPEIIKTVISVSKDSQANKRLMNTLEYYNNFKEHIFSKFMPILSRRFMILEKSSKGSRKFKEAIKISDMVLTLQAALTTGKRVEISITKFLKGLADMKVESEKNIVGGKHGLFKGNVEGMRSIFTMRAVASSIVGKHSLNDVILPWGPSVVVLAPYLVNKLRRRGYRYNFIVKKIMSSIMNYDDEINDIFKELIRERGGKLPAAILRNPAQSNYGTLKLDCPFINPRVSDTTIHLSSQVITFMNGDYDGDELSVILLYDKYLEEAFDNFAPIYSVLGNIPNSIFGKVTITKPMVSIISNKIYQEREILGI